MKVDIILEKVLQEIGWLWYLSDVIVVKDIFLKTGVFRENNWRRVDIGLSVVQS